MNNWHLKQIMKPRLGTIHTRFLKKKDNEKEGKKSETETTKEESETKGDG